MINNSWMPPALSLLHHKAILNSNWSETKWGAMLSMSWLWNERPNPSHWGAPNDVMCDLPE